MSRDCIAAKSFFRGSTKVTQGQEDLCRDAVHTCRYEHPWLQAFTLPPGSGEKDLCRDVVSTCRYGHPWLQADTSTRLVISQSQTRPHVNKLKLPLCER